MPRDTQAFETIPSGVQKSYGASNARRLVPPVSVSPEIACTQEELDERAQLYTDCRENFRQRGIQDLIPEREIIEKNSCARRDSHLNWAAGCSAALLRLPITVIEMVREENDANLRK